jgi:hypothetical protein
MGKVVPMNTTITLRGVKTDLNSAVGHQWVADCCRAGEGLCEDRDLMEKWELSASEFEKISKSPVLLRAVRAESERRVRSGVAASEAAQKIFVRAPAVLGNILDDQHASPKHRIDSARELRACALGNSDDGSAANSEHITISINLGGDIEVYEKTLTPKPPTVEDKTDGE